jgi:hypothetical protein
VIDDRGDQLRSRVRSAYGEQIRRIAPSQLIAREQELTELADFCTRPDMRSYFWLRAPAWSGKSALLAWFVQFPPPDVDIVAFFITGRFAGQSDRAAFTDTVLEQLADLLTEPIPAWLTEATRTAHLLNMFDRAAQQCQQRGRRLVLVVDGLDEDRGVTTGPDAYSIASLLPAHPPTGMRVVVAGRDSPPIPADVATDHPLRDPDIIRSLIPAPHAAVIRHDAQRELARLLDGTTSQRDVLGLLTAAGGGLSAKDLAELSGRPPWEINKQLSTVSGRSFAARPGRWHSGTTVYLLAHEELRHDATISLGPARLTAYQQRLHAWADTYRKQGWPTGTPEYLLSRYSRLLQVTGDVPRMLGIATDRGRHDRMLDTTGGDATALSEIAACGQAVLASLDPDLTAMLRLAVCRGRLKRRNKHIPSSLPAVWARLGHRNRAEALAYSISNPERQIQALAEVAAVLAVAGDEDRGRGLAYEAESAAGSITHPCVRAKAVARIAIAFARMGDEEHSRALASQAEALARSISDSGQKAQALAEVAGALAAGGDRDRARALADEAESAGGSIAEPGEREKTLAGVASALAACDPGRAEMLGRSLSDRSRQVRVLADVAAALAVAGGEGRARILADETHAAVESIADPDERSQALARIATVFAQAGDTDRAETVVRAISDRAWQASTASKVALVVAKLGRLDRARALCGLAESAARSISEPGKKAVALADAAQAAEAAIVDHSWADSLIQEAVLMAHSIAEPNGLAETLARIVVKVDAPRSTVLMAEALQIGDWPICLTALRQIDPSAINAAVYDVLSEAHS